MREDTYKKGHWDGHVARMGLQPVDKTSHAYTSDSAYRQGYNNGYLINITKVYLAEHYSYDGETHVSSLGIYETYELAWEAIYQAIKERHEKGEDWYQIGDFGVTEYELNKQIWLQG